MGSSNETHEDHYPSWPPPYNEPFPSAQLPGVRYFTITMADSTPLMLIRGPTIRRGTEDASLVRSQLMRQRYREKRLRVLRKDTHTNNIPINIQCYENETQALLAGTNLRQISPCRIDPFLSDDRRTGYFDFLLHNCGFSNMATVK